MLPECTGVIESACSSSPTSFASPFQASGIYGYSEIHWGWNPRCVYLTNRGKKFTLQGDQF